MSPCRGPNDPSLMPPFFNPGPIEFPDIKIFIAGVNPNMLKVAGEICDGVLLHSFNTPLYTKEVILPIVESGKEVHLNLKDVSYMDSSGISVLIESHQKALEKNNKVIIKDVSKSVLKVIMMAKLEQILNLE